MPSSCPIALQSCSACAAQSQNSRAGVKSLAYLCRMPSCGSWFVPATYLSSFCVSCDIIGPVARTSFWLGLLVAAYFPPTASSMIKMGARLAVMRFCVSFWCSFGAELACTRQRRRNLLPQSCDSDSYEYLQSLSDTPTLFSTHLSQFSSISAPSATYASIASSQAGRAHSSWAWWTAAPTASRSGGWSRLQTASARQYHPRNPENHAKSC